MTETTNHPWLVEWATPLLGAVGALMTGALYIVRRLLLGLVRDELDKNHAESIQRLDRLETMLQQSREDRQSIHQELQEIKEHDSYERGFEAGRQERPK